METPCLHQGGSLSVWIRTAVRTLGRHRLYSMAKEWKEARTWLANQLLNPIQVDTMYIGESRLKVRLEREGGVFINGCGLDPNLMQPSLSVLVGFAMVVAVKSFSHVQLFATPWTAARQASLSITIFQSLLKLMSIESLMPSSHLPSVHPSPPAFSLSQHQGLF